MASSSTDRERSPPGFVLEAGCVGQRVDQPRLPLGLHPDQFLHICGERLSRFLGVLVEEGEAPHPREKLPKRNDLALMFERTAAGNDRILRGGLDAVIMHIAHPA